MSGKRKEILATGEIYHALNRSIGNTDILAGKRELSRSFQLLEFYRYPQKFKYSKFKKLPIKVKKEYITNYKKQKPLVDILAFALMPSHFHLLLKQLQNNGISVFMSKFQNAFAKYFNKKNDRSGSLFHKSFKAKRIERDEVLLHVSRYIHLNPVTAFIIELENLDSFLWNSYRYYVGNTNNNFVNTKYILDLLGGRKKYEEFVKNQADYQQKLGLIKKYLFE